jgi:hypothetical protein
MRLLVTALVASLAAPAFAQDQTVGIRHKRVEPEAPKKADDKDYNTALDRLPARKYDPWHVTRRPSDSKTGDSKN